MADSGEDFSQFDLSREVWILPDSNKFNLSEQNCSIYWYWKRLSAGEGSTGCWSCSLCSIQNLSKLRMPNQKRWVVSNCVQELPATGSPCCCYKWGQTETGKHLWLWLEGASAFSSFNKKSDPLFATEWVEAAIQLAVAFGMQLIWCASFLEESNCAVQLALFRAIIPTLEACTDGGSMPISIRQKHFCSPWFIFPLEKGAYHLFSYKSNSYNVSVTWAAAFLIEVQDVKTNRLEISDVVVYH